MTKPSTFDEYTPEMLEQMRSICLTIATARGSDGRHDRAAWFPLLLPATVRRATYGAHVGTADVDVALSVTLLDGALQGGRREATRAHFQPDKNADGNTTRHRWRITRGERTGRSSS